MSQPGDCIYIRDLLVRCIIGTKPDERRNPQDIVINLTLYTDLAPAGLSDRLEDTVNYQAVKQDVVRMVEASSFFLVERLADRVARIGLADPRVARVRVSIDKPGALRFARSVAVAIERDRAWCAGQPA